MKAKKMVTASAIALLISMASIPVFAMTNPVSFSGSLPANQGDIEISTVGRKASSTSTKYFTINMSRVDGDANYVRAWTETSAGTNLSPTTNTATEGAGDKNISYTSTPSAGTNVVLNLDNPVKESATRYVVGQWTPN